MSKTTWLQKSSILLNSGKCHYMCLGNKTKKAEISFDGKIFENSKEKTFLGVTKSNKFTFYNHTKGL